MKEAITTSNMGQNQLVCQRPRYLKKICWCLVLQPGWRVLMMTVWWYSSQKGEMCTTIFHSQYTATLLWLGQLKCWVTACVSLPFLTWVSGSTVGGDFSLEFNMGSDSIPYSSFGWECKPGLVCAHMHSITWTQKILNIHVLDGCRQQKHTQHVPSMKMECDYLYGWTKKTEKKKELKWELSTAVTIKWKLEVCQN